MSPFKPQPKASAALNCFNSRTLDPSMITATDRADSTAGCTEQSFLQQLQWRFIISPNIASNLNRLPITSIGTAVSALCTHLAP